jgi:hypothetical protein
MILRLERLPANRHPFKPLKMQPLKYSSFKDDTPSMKTSSKFRYYIFGLLFFEVINQFLSPGVQADDCVQLSLPDEVVALKDFAEDLQFNPATDSQISNAFCARKEAFADAEMNDWLLNNQSGSNANLTVNGISFENESYENLEAFRNLTTYVDFRGQVVGEHKKFNSNCKKVDCAMKEIFGPEISVPLLFMQRRFGMNGSHLVRKPGEAVKWKREELDTVLLGLSDMPDGVLPINKNHPLFRASPQTNSLGAMANATVTIFDAWVNEESAPFKRATLVHELGHSISSETRISTSDKWKQLSGWKIERNEKQVPTLVCEHPENIVSTYGKENYDEDFAESVFAYRYNPELLRKKSEEKYNLIKSTVFDGVEYTSEESCKNPQRISKKFEKDIEKGLKTWSPNESDIKYIAKDIASRCGKNIIHQLFAEQKVEPKSNYLESCYNKSLDQYLASRSEKELSSLPYPKHIGPMVKNIRPSIALTKRNDIILAAQLENTNRLNKIFTEILSSASACISDNQEVTSKRLQGLYDREKVRFKTELQEIIKNACEKKK